MRSRASEFNKKYPVGTPVRYYPYIGSLSSTTKTRSPAWDLPDGHTLVSVDGVSGGVNIENIDGICDDSLSVMTKDDQIDKLLDLIMDVIIENCERNDGIFDSGGIVAYSDSIRVLAFYERLFITGESGRRILARRV